VIFETKHEVHVVQIRHGKQRRLGETGGDD
jgi:hypothetical protein